MKPKPSKWLDSFNSNFTTGYEDTTETIKRSIRLIRDQALIENAWQLNKLDQSFMSFEKRLAAWVNEIRNEKNEAGGTMATLMLQMTERSTQSLLISKPHLDASLTVLGYFQLVYGKNASNACNYKAKIRLEEQQQEALHR